MASSPPQIAFDRSGAGEPLLLLPGIGMTRLAWKPVLPLLHAQRDVIAVDLPGHGDSPAMPPHLIPAPPGFAYLLSELMDELGIERAHVAGNSLGGWTALELAKLGRARSVVALGPAGLWPHGPLRPVLQLGATYRGARRLHRLARPLMRPRAGRTLLLGHTFGSPSRVPAEDAAGILEALAGADGFQTTLIATHMMRFEGGRNLNLPVTIVFGGRDRVVPGHARRRDELPPHTRWVEPPHLGHVPMWDDPELVAQLILSS